MIDDGIVLVATRELHKVTVGLERVQLREFHETWPTTRWTAPRTKGFQPSVLKCSVKSQKYLRFSKTKVEMVP